jgi:hypothetical protein
MTNLIAADQIAALRGLVFGAVASWNAAHPHRLRSHHEHAAVNVALVYGDADGAPRYAVTVDCTLSGSAPLTFHGTDLATVAEQARLTLEHKIDVELHRRAGHVHHLHLTAHGIAV